MLFLILPICVCHLLSIFRYWFISGFEKLGDNNTYTKANDVTNYWVPPEEFDGLFEFNGDYHYTYAFFWATMATLGAGRDVEPLANSEHYFT